MYVICNHGETISIAKLDHTYIRLHSAKELNDSVETFRSHDLFICKLSTKCPVSEVHQRAIWSLVRPALGGHISPRLSGCQDKKGGPPLVFA